MITCQLHDKWCVGNQIITILLLIKNCNNCHYEDPSFYGHLKKLQKKLSSVYSFSVPAVSQTAKLSQPKFGICG